MSRKKYLLPCSCGRQIPIEVTQAGQRLTCECGLVVDAPTMQGIRQLRPAEVQQAAAPTRRFWGLRQQLVLLGAAVTLVAATCAAYRHWARPRLIDVDRLTVAQSWAVWQSFRLGVSPRSRSYEQFLSDLKAHRRWMGVIAAIGAIGLLTMGSALLVPSPHSRPPASANP